MGERICLASEMGEECDAIAQAAAFSIEHGLTAIIGTTGGVENGTNAAVSGALRGICAAMWKMRKPGITRPILLEHLSAALAHGLEQEEAAELMGGPVAGRG